MPDNTPLANGPLAIIAIFLDFAIFKKLFFGFCLNKLKTSCILFTSLKFIAAYASSKLKTEKP